MKFLFVIWDNIYDTDDIYSFRFINYSWMEICVKRILTTADANSKATIHHHPVPSYLHAFM
jgi:hypothetical protein